MKNTQKLYYDNANSTTHAEALGIEEKRGDEIASVAVKTALSAKIDPEIETSGHMVDVAINSAAPQNMQEAFYLGWALAKAQSEIENKFDSNPLAQLFKMMGK